MICITLASTAIFGYIISNVTAILEAAAREEETYRKELVEMNNYFRKAKVSNKL